MGYYLRFINTGEQPVTVEDVTRALQAADAQYHFEPFNTEVIVRHGDALVAHVTLNAPGDGLFEEERDELLEEAADGKGRGKAKALEALRDARQIVAVQLLHGTGDLEPTLRLLDPLWDWLQANRTRLSQLDGEGYYEGERLILRLT